MLRCLELVYLQTFETREDVLSTPFNSMFEPRDHHSSSVGTFDNNHDDIRLPYRILPLGSSDSQNQKNLSGIVDTAMGGGLLYRVCLKGREC